LWFIGDPDLPGHERIDEGLHLHRWCQWISRHHPQGVYDGEDFKERDFASSLPPFLYDRFIAPAITSSEPVVVLAEEWHTVHAVLHLDWLLSEAGIRDRVQIAWNANNVFGFDRIDFPRLARAATVTTVSRYMRQLMWPLGCDPLVIPNGLGRDAYPRVPSAQLRAFSKRLEGRLVVSKMARWDPDKRWLSAIDSIGELRRMGQRPLLIARGGAEAHGAEVWERAQALDLKIVQRGDLAGGPRGLLQALDHLDQIDILVLDSHVDAEARRLLFRGSHAVLANSGHEPFGLVGLEAMAVGGVACTGCTGEDYAIPGRNALVLQRNDPAEFIRLFEHLRATDGAERALRRNARRTALDFAWERIVDRVLFPQLGMEPPGAREPDRPLGHPAIVSLPVGFAQLGLENLAGRIAG